MVLVKPDVAINANGAMGALVDGRLVVRDHQQGLAFFFAQPIEKPQEVVARCTIDARQGFVKDEHVGLRGEASGNDRALLLAAGQAVNVPFSHVF